jgi:REP-associated tyrosine transposase
VPSGGLGVEVALARPMITNNPGHLKGFGYVGVYRYSLSFCTDARRHLFADREVVELVLQQLLRAANEQKFAVIAYCFMPDHLHLLIEGTSDDSDGKRFMKAFKQYSGYYYAKARQCTLWQRYGFEHVLRDDEATVEVVKYILRNPVRAGLAASVEEYPFVGSLAYELKDLINSMSG